ncbi:DUF1848 domain-containing protein [Terasakiella sp.]|uniref:DUF1848 domain-containing protein n=1 Tax=Terasakiella sp. TaxID=2034861 RepID=UPI003AA8F51B
MGQIVSISRRTDIAAFYSDWFINRVHAGFVKTRNPFNPNQIREISLHPEDVDCFIFWTRNPAPLFPHLDMLEKRSFASYFHMTITGYPREIENSTPSLEQAINHFKTLSQKVGPDRVIWRYDPILLSNVTPIQYHIDTFDKIAHALQGHTHTVMFALTDFYAKTERNLKKVNALVYQDIAQQEDDLNRVLAALSTIARSCGLSLKSCAQEQDWRAFSIEHGKCIDDDLIRKISKTDQHWRKDKSQRKACGCVQSVDIGAYNSCLHGCQYCYATYNNAQAKDAYRQHDPQSPFLLERSATKNVKQS